jgi:hypothetical protein
VATPAPTLWRHREPGLWPSTAQASALLHSLEALARLQEHIALTGGVEPASNSDLPGPNGDSARPARAAFHLPATWFRW